MLELNETGSEIMELCDGARSLDEIVRLLAAKFEAPAELLRTDVADYLLRLRTKGLLEVVAPSDNPT
jgi:coenzyme PQQ biosynthesis protein PqqD